MTMANLLSRIALEDLVEGCYEAWALEMDNLEEHLIWLDSQTRGHLSEVATALNLHAGELESRCLSAYCAANRSMPGPSDTGAERLASQFLKLFFEHIPAGDFDGFLLGLDQAGARAAKESVRYGGLVAAILCCEEVCTSFLTERYSRQGGLPALLVALGRLFRSAVAVVSSAYFRDLLVQTKTISDAAEAQRAWAETVTNVSPDGILVSDGNRNIVSVNPALEELIGYSKDELLGQFCRYVLGGRDSSGSPLCDCICPLVREPEGEIPPLEATILTKDGRKVWVEARYGVMRNQDGAISGVVHSFRDITERKETERLRSELLSVASHELRTPITSVKGYTQLLLRRLPGTREAESQRRALEVMDGQLDRMAGIVEELVEMSRAQTGRLHLEVEPVDMVQIASDAVERMQVTTGSHRLRITRADSRPVFADRFRIDQVLTNLLSNAIRYSPEGGEIEVSVESLENEVLVSVRDQGIGIPPEEQGRVFDQFYQVRSGVAAGTLGMGLGLYISQEIVKRHGGRIGVESAGGEGSRFYFTIPTSLVAAACGEGKQQKAMS